MRKSRLPKVDRRVFAVAALGDNSDEKCYRLAKSPLERLEALEVMRQMVYGYDPLTTRLQRVFKVTQRA